MKLLITFLLLCWIFVCDAQDNRPDWAYREKGGQIIVTLIGEKKIEITNPVVVMRELADYDRDKQYFHTDTICADTIIGNKYIYTHLPSRLWALFVLADGFPLNMTLVQAQRKPAVNGKIGEGAVNEYTFELQGYDKKWKEKPPREYTENDIRIMMSELLSQIVELNRNRTGNIYHSIRK